MEQGGGFEWAGAPSEGTEQPENTGTTYDLGTRLDGHTVPAGTNVLVVGPPMAGTRRFGLEVLGDGSDGDRPIIVSNCETARSIRNDYGECLDGPVGIVDCVTKQGAEPTLEHSMIRYAGAPDDLTGIGVELLKLLDEASGKGVRALFDSVSTLLMYTETERAFRFLDLVTARLTEAEAVGLFALNPAAHSEAVCETLSHLFDGIVRLEDDGVASVDLPEC